MPLEREPYHTGDQKAIGENRSGENRIDTAELIICPAAVAVKVGAAGENIFRVAIG